MKNLLVATALIAVSAAAAQAQVNLDVGINSAPRAAYVEPVYPSYYEQHPPTVAVTGRDHFRRDYDWSYWNHAHEANHHDNHRDIHDVR